MVLTTTRRPRTAKRLAAKAAAAEPKRTRNVRTSEQRIADLEAQIEQVKRRAAAKRVKKDPALRYVSGALRSIDKALASSEDHASREALLAYILAHPGSRSEDIAVGLGMDTAGIRPSLVALKQADRVVVEGKARATKYSAVSGPN
jgi:hypothetical protein